jgi:ABC-type transport system involved in multi-copper enzyme maturation permease subunit
MQILTDAWIVASFEFKHAFKSAKAVVFIVLYSLAALISGLIYIQIVRGLENNAFKLMVKSGTDPLQAQLAMGQVKSLGMKELFEFFSGGDQTMADYLIGIPPIILFFFWGSLAFLPFLIALMSFDQLSGDLKARMIRFLTPRTHRVSIALGKLLSQTGVFMIVTVANSLVILAVAAARLSSFDVSVGLLYLLKFWCFLLFFGWCYLGLMLMWSAVTTTPIYSLLMGILSLTLFWLLSFLSKLDSLDSWHRYLSYLSYLSPSHYEKGLWRPEWGEALGALCAFLIFGLVFFGIGCEVLRRRDL